MQAKLGSGASQEGLSMQRILAMFTLVLALVALPVYAQQRPAPLSGSTLSSPQAGSNTDSTLRIAASRLFAGPYGSVEITSKQLVGATVHFNRVGSNAGPDLWGGLIASYSARYWTDLEGSSVELVLYLATPIEIKSEGSAMFRVDRLIGKIFGPSEGASGSAWTMSGTNEVGRVDLGSVWIVIDLNK